MKLEDLSFDVESYVGSVQVNENVTIDYEFGGNALIEAPRVYMDGESVSRNIFQEYKDKYSDGFIVDGDIDEGVAYRTDIDSVVAYNWEFMHSIKTSFNEILSASKNEDDFINRVDSIVTKAFDFDAYEKFKAQSPEDSISIFWNDTYSKFKNAKSEYDKFKIAVDNDLLGVEIINDELQGTGFELASVPICGDFFINGTQVLYEYLIDYDSTYHEFSSWKEWLNIDADKISYNKFVEQSGTVVPDSSYLSEQMGLTLDNEDVTINFEHSNIIFSIEDIIKQSNTEEEFEKNAKTALADAYKKTYGNKIIDMLAKDGEETVKNHYFISLDKNRIESYMDRDGRIHTDTTCYDKYPHILAEKLIDRLEEKKEVIDILLTPDIGSELPITFIIDSDLSVRANGCLTINPLSDFPPEKIEILKQIGFSKVDDDIYQKNYSIYLMPSEEKHIVSVTEQYFLSLGSSIKHEFEDDKNSPHNIAAVIDKLNDSTLGELEKFEYIQKARANGINCDTLSILPSDFTLTAKDFSISDEGVWSKKNPSNKGLPCCSAILLDRMAQEGYDADYRAVLALTDAQARVGAIARKNMANEFNKHFNVSCDRFIEIYFGFEFKSDFSPEEIKKLVEDGKIFTKEEAEALKAVDYMPQGNVFELPLDDKEEKTIKDMAFATYKVNEHYIEEKRLSVQSGFKVVCQQDVNTYILEGKNEYNTFYPTYEYHADEDKLICINRFDGDEGIMLDVTRKIKEEINYAINSISKPQQKISVNIKQKAIQEINSYIDSLVDAMKQYNPVKHNDVRSYLENYEASHGFGIEYLPASEFNALVSKFEKVSQNGNVSAYEQIGNEAKKIAKNIIEKSKGTSVEELISEVKSSETFKKVISPLHQESEKSNKEEPEPEGNMLAEYIISQGTSKTSLMDYAGYNLSVSCIDDVYSITVQKPFTGKIGKTSVKGERILGGTDVAKENLGKFFDSIAEGSAVLFSKEFGEKTIKEINEIINSKERTRKNK